MYVYVLTYMHTHTYLYTYVCTCTHTYTHVSACTLRLKTDQFKCWGNGANGAVCCFSFNCVCLFYSLCSVAEYT